MAGIQRSNMRFKAWLAQTARRCAVAITLALVAVGLYAGEPLAPVPPSTQPADQPVDAAQMRRMIEQDWIDALVRPVTTQTDAAGACDGVRNGKYGFHTGHDVHPWWQVDLQRRTHIDRIVIYNRLDYAPGLHNADSLQVRGSDDGQHWNTLYDNRGQHFGGITGAAPLTIQFPYRPVFTRFIRVQLPGPKPVFLHLDEVEIYGADSPQQNVALGRPANQSSLSPWSTSKTPVRIVYPTAARIDRARRLVEDLRATGVDSDAFVHQLDAMTRRWEALPEDADTEQRRQLYLETCWAIRRIVFANPVFDSWQLLFVKRFGQETYPDVCLNHMPWVSRPGGDLCVLSNPFSVNAAGQSLCRVLNRALGPGHIHGMDLWYDGSRIVFGYARARQKSPPEGWLDRTTSYRLRRQQEPTHIFEVGVDGTRLRQLTDGQWSDLDPTYAPNGDIVFVSERCGTSLQCNEYDKDETSCNLYVMHSDGGGIRRLSVNKDGDYLPHTLDDGTIGYTRWEYHERSFAYIQSIWSIRPDGTGADALFKQHFAFPWALEDVRSIPDSDTLVAVAAGHHTLAAGPVVLINTATGINMPTGIGIVTPGVRPPEGAMDGVPVAGGGVVDYRGFYGTPWPLSDKVFLVAYAYGTRPLGSPAAEVDPTGYALYLIDVFGNKELIHRDPAISCFSPIPLRPRRRPPALPEQVALGESMATCVVRNIADGCDGIDPQSVRYLRIAEPIGWPYDNQSGGHRYVEDHQCRQPTGEPKIEDESWTPIRVLGDVPVADDGSVTFRVPADRAVYFQLLDEQRMELRRMRSFISFQPGETRACVGCHESRGRAPDGFSLVSTRHGTGAVALPLPAPWGTQPLSFLRDVQPVLDRHCTRCHSGLHPAGEIDLSGGLTSYDRAVPGYGYNRAYTTLMTQGLVSRSPARKQDASITPPLAFGSHRSRLIQVLKDGTHAPTVHLGATDRLRLTMWVDANAPYHDRFINKRTVRKVYDLAADESLQRSLNAVHDRRCNSCHTSSDVSRLDWIDLKVPQNSRFLTAPLARAAGGTGACGKAVYRSPNDGDYQTLLALVRQSVTRAWAQPRRDLVSLQDDNNQLAPGR